MNNINTNTHAADPIDFASVHRAPRTRRPRGKPKIIVERKFNGTQNMKDAVMDMIEYRAIIKFDEWYNQDYAG